MAERLANLFAWRAAPPAGIQLVIPEVVVTFQLGLHLEIEVSPDRRSCGKILRVIRSVPTSKEGRIVGIRHLTDTPLPKGIFLQRDETKQEDYFSVPIFANDTYRLVPYTDRNLCWLSPGKPATVRVGINGKGPSPSQEIIREIFEEVNTRTSALMDQLSITPQPLPT